MKLNDKQKELLRKAGKAMLYHSIAFILAAIPSIISGNPVFMGISIPVAFCVRYLAGLWEQFWKYDSEIVA